ncbi:UNVERIFIED_CONTAM: hypothetical protein NCL1_22437 [Trichonephila clavipes]
MNQTVSFSALVALSIADCSVDDFRCCLSEFLPLVSPAGIQLTEKRLAAACTFFPLEWRFLVTLRRGRALGIPKETESMHDSQRPGRRLLTSDSSKSTMAQETNGVIGI